MSKVLAGRYELLERIGEGGMSVVYKAKDKLLNRFVAIKILKPEFIGDHKFIDSFRRESQAAASMSHPNIVNIYDVGKEGNIHYIVMELIEGRALSDVIKEQGPMPYPQVISISKQIAAALSFAHKNHIIHRDVKPHNIMMTPNGTAKITDFGIARFSSNATRTMTEQAIGSVHYIAPEQARGEKTDGKTDIYSVGVMMYEMLTGTLPFDGDSAVSVALMQLQANAKRPREINPDIPEGLEEITIKAMQKNPADRYHSAVEMLSDIERFRLNPSILFNYQFSDTDRAVDDVGIQRLEPEYEEPDDGEEDAIYEEDVPVRSPVLSAIKGVILAAVIALVVFGGIAAYQGYISAQPKEIEVPNFVGMTLSEANAQNNGKFNFTYVSRFSDDIAVDTIIEQSPAGGSKKMKEGSTIELIVNSADTSVQVPYISGSIGSEEIIQRIESANLVPKILYVESAQTAQKVDAVYPPTGTEVKIGSTVYVFVSKGVTKEKIKMPTIKGYTAEEAVEILKDAGFTDYSVEYDENIVAGKDEVVRQNPLQGSEVTSDYKIKVICSKGENKEKAVNLEVDLPSDVSSEVKLTVLLDGAIDSENSKSVIPAYSPYYTVNLKVKDDANIVILLDDEKYREYKVNYDNNSIDLINSYSYTPKQTEAPATEAPAASSDTSSEEVTAQE